MSADDLIYETDGTDDIAASIVNVSRALAKACRLGPAVVDFDGHEVAIHGAMPTGEVVTITKPGRYMASWTPGAGVSVALVGPVDTEEG